MKFPLSLQHWPRWRRRLLAGLLLTGLLVAGFYTEEKIRGRILLDRAIDESRQEGIPQSAAGVYAPLPPKERNFFYSKAFQNRILWQEDRWGGEENEGALPISWGDIKLVSSPEGKNFPRLMYGPRDGRGLDYEEIRKAMGELGWTIADGLSTAGAVRGALDRFQIELSEWATEIRNRPEWLVPVKEVRFHSVFEKALAQATRVFTLRAMAGAAAGRPGSEVLDDLQSAALLSGYSWFDGAPVIAAVWEILRHRHLNDGELVQLAGFLPDQPATEALLEETWFLSHHFMETVLSPVSGGNKEAEEVYWEYWPEDVMGPFKKRLLMMLKPQGWYLQEEAFRYRVMIANRDWLRGITAAWKDGRPTPDKPETLDEPWHGLLSR